MNGLNFQMPEAVEIDESTHTDTYGKFIVQPLERGYGVTIGNSLRRVLISTLQGAAIVTIKIDGILHEFSTIPGVSEDVTEMILNLKGVRFKLLNKKPDKIYVQLKGPKEFTARDLQIGNNDFEILNPDHLIATLNSESELKMELSIKKGRGYVPAEENRPSDAPIGTIPLDAIYSPIRNVTYTIENTRVGQRTDYEKLILEIWTDGSITPEDALSNAGRILRDHIQLFISFDMKPEKEDDEDIDEETLQIRKLLRKPVEDLELSVRSANCLKEAKIRTIADLVRRDENEMLRFKNFGRKSLVELNEILKTKSLHFGMDVEKYLSADYDKK
ncbi:MAG: DNA-directed RNA polymerase subunit alpha [Calditrichaeota bacterium]|nr:DNA-directed RNA polymerase subunit alpha [Calditrichota bacterium]MCB9368559.1 DNA-directed RNA polymerase subunit alpha [Calditrichota bacterium]